MRSADSQLLGCSAEFSQEKNVCGTERGQGEGVGFFRYINEPTEAPVLLVRRGLEVECVVGGEAEIFFGRSQIAWPFLYSPSS